MRPATAAALEMTHDELPSEPPPSRDRYPTMEFDLSEFALENTGPDSWSATQDEPPDEDDVRWQIATGPLVDVWPCDVPCVALSFEERSERLLDHREAFVLSLLDGQSSVAAMLDMESLPACELLAILCDLCSRGVITLDRSQRAALRANDSE
jgi:hypothetical protein